MGFLSDIRPRDVVGAALPPPGVTPNFVNPVSHQPQVVAVNVVCLVFVVLFVLMRLWTKVCVKRSAGWDDLLCVVALAFLVAHFVAIMQLLQCGFGIHIWDLPKEIFNRPRFLKWSMAASFIAQVALTIIKISILLLYLQLFSVHSGLRYTIYTVIGLLASNFAAGITVFLLTCRPLTKMIQPELPGKCLDIDKVAISQGLINLHFDIVIFVLPLPTIWLLQLPKRKKLATSAILTLGLIACVAGAIRIYFIISQFPGNQQDQAIDWSWLQVNNTLCGIVEMSIGLICSCAPAFKPFVEYLMLRFRKIRTNDLEKFQEFN